jgi:non-ribosomal peptide synthase protein (TIGR01720 family)
VRGYRIELGEIEEVLREHPGVRDGVVVVREEETGKRLVGYVVGKSEPSEMGDLRGYLKERLPDYMVPAQFVELKELPLTLNGKINRNALPLPEANIAIRSDESPESWTPAEKLLAEIWADVLGIPEVGIHHNFFDIGGDSILSIQIAARAKQAGIHVSPRQVFQHPTIAGLVAAAGVSKQTIAEQGTVNGPVPLTPIQHWFFEQNFEHPEHWNQAVLLQVRGQWEPEVLRAAFQKLHFHHDALRLRFYREESGWRQVNASADDMLPFELRDVSALSSRAQERAVEKQAQELHSTFNLANGPLFRAAFFTTGNGEFDYLLMGAHHLIIDAVSWRVLVEDLESSCSQLHRGDQVRLPQKTISYRQWSLQLQRYAQEESLYDELKYWSEVNKQHFGRLPVDINNGINDVDSAEEISVSFTEEETALLLDCLVRHKANVEETLLAALVAVLKQWSHENVLTIDMEGHGREELAQSEYPARTVGWFTTIFPVRFQLDSSNHPTHVLSLVKEQLRAVPNRGLGYSVLRYLGNEETRSKLKSLPSAEVSFNYLGKLDRGLSSSSSLSLSSLRSGSAHSPLNHRTHLLEITAAIRQGRLQLVWRFSANIHKPATIRKVAKNFTRTLKLLTGARSGKYSESYIPSDFSLPTLTQEDLDAIVHAAQPDFDNEVEDICALTPVQQGMLFHSLYTPQSGIYFPQVACRLANRLDLGVFQQAWHDTVNNHDALRASFFSGARGEMAQVIHRNVVPRWRLFDWRGLSPAEQAKQLRTYMEKDRLEEFQPGEAPLVRLALMRTQDEEHWFVWGHHHAVLDGWSSALIFKEVIERYEALLGAGAMKTRASRSFRDYVKWLGKQELLRAEEFWRLYLTGFKTPTSLAVDSGGSISPPEHQHFKVEELVIGKKLASGLRELARGNQLTLHTVLQGAWALLLGHESGNQDVVFGVVSSGRPADLPGVDSMVGLFVNTLPIRVAVSSNQPLLSWLKELQVQQAELRQFEHTPLVQIHKWSEIEPSVALFNTVFSFNSYPIHEVLRTEHKILKVRDVQSIDWNSYAFTVAVSPGDSIAVHIKYDSRRFQGPAIHRIAHLYEAVLDATATQPGMLLPEMNALMAQSQRRLEESSQHNYKVSIQDKLQQLRPRPGHQVPSSSH